MKRVEPSSEGGSMSLSVCALQFMVAVARSCEAINENKLQCAVSAARGTSTLAEEAVATCNSGSPTSVVASVAVMESKTRSFRFVSMIY